MRQAVWCRLHSLLHRPRRHSVSMTMAGSELRTAHGEPARPRGTPDQDPPERGLFRLVRAPIEQQVGGLALDFLRHLSGLAPTPWAANSRIASAAQSNDERDVPPQVDRAAG